MYHYTLLDNDAKFLGRVETWKQNGVTSVAMDFEGEFNLHVYGEHLCLIQLYDGANFFLADPFCISPQALRTFLEDDGTEKVMFDCASDASLVRKQYKIQLENIYDIRIPAMALGYMGNLSGLMELHHLPHVEGDKKRNQTTNWLQRPLSEEQIQYALGDVADLFALKKILEEQIKGKRLEHEVASKMRVCAKQKNPERPGWEKLPSYRFYTREEQVYAKHFFLARDGIARCHNLPAARILDKHSLMSLIRDVPANEMAFRSRIRCSDELLEALLRAKEDARHELVERG
ncbi:MAG: 3'-5' exonuclease [Sphaerochaetaceae bacterium]